MGEIKLTLGGKVVGKLTSAPKKKVSARPKAKTAKGVSKSCCTGKRVPLGGGK